MINIQRTPNVPSSLATQEVRDFLEALAQHTEDPAAFPMPKKPSGYRNSDVLAAFDACFLSKCYLTEQRFENSWPMDVDHFKSYGERKELVFEWTNLYPAEHRANMMKPRKTPEGGYLDPCSPDDDVEKDIIYTLLPEGGIGFQARDANNLKAVNSALLLDYLHNGKPGEDSEKSTADLRALIDRKYKKILNAIIEWQAARERRERQDEVDAEIRLKRLLSRRASFTALIRSVSAVRRYVPADFLD